MGNCIRAILVLAAICGLPCLANAKVTITDTGTCGGDCKYYVIDLSGRIDEQTKADFLKALADPRIANTKQGIGPIVRLDSPGGSVVAAMDIGDAIRAANYWSGVYEHHECASACVLILAAGVHRDAAWGRIIIHRPHFDEESFGQMAPAQAREQYERMAARVREYLRRMGMADALYLDMLKVPSDDGRVLSVKNIKEYGLDGEDPAWAEWRRANMITTVGREQYAATTSIGAVMTACINSPRMVRHSLPVAEGKCETEVRPVFEAKLTACADKTGDEFAACAKSIEIEMAAKYR